MKNYVATYVDKCVSREQKNNAHQLSCTMASHIDVSSGTLVGLLNLLASKYGDGDKTLWNCQEENGFVSFSRHEDGDGTPLLHEELVAAWESGREVYFCVYTFTCVERHESYVDIHDIHKAIEYVSSETAALTEER